MPSPAPGPPARNRDSAAARSALLADFSLDITSKELSELVPAGAVIPAGTPLRRRRWDGGGWAATWSRSSDSTQPRFWRGSPAAGHDALAASYHVAQLPIQRAGVSQAGRARYPLETKDSSGSSSPGSMARARSG